MRKAQQLFINALLVLLNNTAMLIALLISYLIRSGRLAVLQKSIDQLRLLSFIKIKSKP